MWYCMCSVTEGVEKCPLFSVSHDRENRAERVSNTSHHLIEASDATVLKS